MATQDVLLSRTEQGYSLAGLTVSTEAKVATRVVIQLLSETHYDRGCDLSASVAKAQLRTNADVIGVTSLSLASVRSRLNSFQLNGYIKFINLTDFSQPDSHTLNLELAVSATEGDVQVLTTVTP